MDENTQKGPPEAGAEATKEQLDKAHDDALKSQLSKIVTEKDQKEENESIEDSSDYLSQLRDVPVKVTAVLGSSRLQISELAELATGSVVELDRKIGDQIDIFVNDHLVAHGEVVINDGHLGISLTEIITTQE